MAIAEKDKVLTTAQAARLLSTSRQTLIVLVNKGIIQAAMVGNRYRFSKLKLLRYITTGEPQGTPKPQGKGQGGPQ